MAHPVARSLLRASVAALVVATLVAQVPAMPALGATAAGPALATTDPDVADTIAPTAPANLRVVSRTKSSAITLGWDASYDAVGVAGYRFYRNGSWVGTLYQAGVDVLGTVMFDRLTGRTKTPITYEVYAFDAAGNVSAPATLVVTP
jgi:hypothetical protein